MVMKWEPSFPQHKKKKTNKQKTIYVVLNSNKQTDYLLSKLPKHPQTLMLLCGLSNNVLKSKFKMSAYDAK